MERYFFVYVIRNQLTKALEPHVVSGASKDSVQLTAYLVRSGVPVTNLYYIGDVLAEVPQLDRDRAASGG